MVKVIDIEEISNRFINRERLEKIKNRIQRLPQGHYYSNGEIYCLLNGEEYGSPIFSEPLYPGLTDLLVNLKSDMEALIKHVENADIENDKLIEQIKALTNVSTQGNK